MHTIKCDIRTKNTVPAGIHMSPPSQVPAVFHKTKTKTVPIIVERRDIRRVLKSKSDLVEIKLRGRSHLARLVDIKKDPLTKVTIHATFKK